MTYHKVEIDFNFVDSLLMADCNGMEIASRLGIHEDTLYNRVRELYGMTFTAYSAQKRAKGDACIKQKQFDKALDGDNTMLVWLGKIRLGQKDPDKQPSQQNNAVDIHQLIGLLNQLVGGQSALSKLGQSSVENKESVLDQGQVGKQDQVPA